MHAIEMQEMSPEFLKCWQAAGLHLKNQAGAMAVTLNPALNFGRWTLRDEAAQRRELLR